MATDGENINKYVREARRLKIPVLPPDINHSAQKFTIEGDSIRYGIDSLRGIGVATGRAIQRNRPYNSLADYLERSESGANKGAAYNLIRVGAFDTLGDRVELLKELQYHRALEGLAESTKANPERLQKIVEGRLARPQFAIEIPDFDDPQVVYEIENELVGNHITVDPMGPYLDVITQHCIADPSQIDGFERKDHFYIGGQVIGIKPWVIKKEGKNKGKEMAFLNVQWNELDFDITCFTEMWVKVRDMIKIGVPVIFQVEKDDRGCHLIDLERLDLLRRRVS
jgi:DNA polymerase-3 subunit alpha